MLKYFQLSSIYRRKMLKNSSCPLCYYCLVKAFSVMLCKLNIWLGVFVQASTNVMSLIMKEQIFEQSIEQEI